MRPGYPRRRQLRYISLLEEVFLIKRIPAWSGNISTRAGRTPKVAFVDSGIAANLLGADARSLIRPQAPSGHCSRASSSRNSRARRHGHRQG